MHAESVCAEETRSLRRMDLQVSLAGKTVNLDEWGRVVFILFSQYFFISSGEENVVVNGGILNETT